MRRRYLFPTFFSLIVPILSSFGCQPSPTLTPLGRPIPIISITSVAFSESETIPVKHTCDGEDISPSLEWSGKPNNTQSLVLIADDPDAPIGTWVHWVIFNIPSSLNGLPEGIARSEVVEGVGTQGKNDSRQIGYNGPCPPKGKPHRYFFKLYALDITLDLTAGAAKGDIENAMKGHILAQGQLIGMYGR
jgi:Raf kinase inhibitor-like YbhB/YbcL family protein